MNIVDKSIKLAYDLLPSADKRRYYHFCMVWDKNRLVSIGQNNMTKENNKALKFAKRFKTSDKFKYIHAEVDAVSKLWGKVYIQPHFKFVVIRVNTLGEIQESKPCPACSEVLNGLNIKRVYWSQRDGSIASN